MQQLLGQLGIDWHLLLSQAINFFLLLVILRLLVYKPVLAILEERRKKIEEGLAKATEADERLQEIDEIGKGRIKKAEAEAVAILKKVEVDAKENEAKMLAEAKRKEAEEVKSLEAVLRAREEESKRMAEKEAVAMVRRAIVKTVELSPGNIDDALITRAIEEAKKNI